MCRLRASSVLPSMALAEAVGGVHSIRGLSLLPKKTEASAQAFDCGAGPWPAKGPGSPEVTKWRQSLPGPQTNAPFIAGESHLPLFASESDSLVGGES